MNSETQQGALIWAPFLTRWRPPLAYVEHLADFPTCDQIPHAIMNIQLVYCPHDRGYTMSCTLGDTSEHAWSHRLYRYGPFDTPRDIGADVGQWISVMMRRELLEGAMVLHGADGGEAPIDLPPTT